MNTLKLALMIAVGLFGALSQCRAQGSASSRQAPTAATVVAPSFPSLTPGRDLIFQIQFDRAPKGYDEGKGIIKCKFVNTKGFTMNSIYGHVGEEKVTWDQIDLQNGQAVYAARLQIRDSMARGMWKLTEISVGEGEMIPVRIVSDVTFQIPGPAPVAISIDAPRTWVAGHPYNFKISLETPPQDIPEFCQLTLTGAIRLSPRLGGPTDSQFPGSVIAPSI